MMRSLYSAITGLKNHQISMDVIGNNISNVNTPGYKKARTTFATMLGQAVRGASAPDTAATPKYGGTNGIMVGLGSVLGSVDTVMGQGSTQYTGKATDMMIQGEGMFVLKLGGNNVYTRTGNFGFDKQGNLIDPSTGAFVQGYKNSAAITAGTPPTVAATDWATNGLGNITFKIGDELAPDPADPSASSIAGYTLNSYSIDQYGVVTGVYSNGANSVTRELYKVSLASFANPAGLSAQGNNYYSESNNSGSADIGDPGDGGRGTIVPNTLEMSNVDLSQEFTDMIVTQRGFQANSRVITVSDTILQELIDLKRN
jgi:flagellar hook protein FlgE